MFARHPVSKELLEKKLEVHKDKTLRHATQEAHRVSGGVTGGVVCVMLMTLCWCSCWAYLEYFQWRDVDWYSTRSIQRPWTSPLITISR